MRFLSFLAVVVIAAVGCGPSPSSCVPGAQIACACPVGTGLQRCNASGTFDECVCAGDAGSIDAGSDAGDRIDSGPAPIDSGSDMDVFVPIDAPDAPPMRDAGPAPACTDELDLLLMIDNSNSMSEEQESLTAELPRLVRALATGDLDGDGTPELVPISSLHVGIVTSDMGVGGFAVPTCDRGTFGSRFGDDGILITRGRTTIPGCSATYPAVFTFMSGDSASTFAADVACVATAGTGGCGFEQQLDAVLKALSPAAPQPWTAIDFVAPSFVESTSGHATGMNAGFVRPGSILAALLVTDEEDCSASNPDVFNPSSPTFSGTDLNMRCFTYPDTQHPISRYVDGLAQLRRDPARLVFSVIAGVPEDLSGDTVSEYAAILADARMEQRPDDTTGPPPTRLVPSCNVPGRGLAFPPRRIVSVASELDLAGAQTSVESICRASFAPAIDALVGAIADAAAACP